MTQLSEFTYTIDTTHRMLSSLEHLCFSSGIHPYALAPTQIEEGRFEGHDVRIETIKLLLFQFKRPRSRNGYISFDIPLHQLYTLQRRVHWQQGIAYYVLPIMFTTRDIQIAIISNSYFSNIFYVDATDIPSWTRRLILDGTQCEAVGAYKHTGIGLLTWQEILTRMQCCSIGMRFFEPSDDTFKLTESGEGFIEEGEMLKQLSRTFSTSESVKDRMSVILRLEEYYSKRPEWVNPQKIVTERKTQDFKSMIEFYKRIADNRKIKTIDFAFGGIRRSQNLLVPVAQTPTQEKIRRED